METLKIIIGVIVALGSGGGIVLGLSNYIGKLLAKSYEEKIKSQFQKEVNKYQLQLDILKQTSIRYSDKQFELYNKLWSSLCEVKFLAEALWTKATPSRLTKFSKQLIETKAELEKASLLVEDSHYEELSKIIVHFLEYQVGKSTLISYRQTSDIDDFEVRKMIDDNGLKKKEFETLIKIVKTEMKKQIGGK